MSELKLEKAKCYHCNKTIVLSKIFSQKIISELGKKHSDSMKTKYDKKINRLINTIENHESKIIAARKKNINLERQLKNFNRGLTPKSVGDDLEIKALEILKKAFPKDDIILEGKKGDIIHTINLDKESEDIFTIVYECKSVLRVTTKNIEDVYKAKRKAKAHLAILVTNGTLPKNHKIDFPVTSIESIKEVIICIRHAIFISYQNSKSSRFNPNEAIELLRSCEFQNSLEEIKQEIDKTIRIIEKGHSHLGQVFVKIQKTLQDLKRNFTINVTNKINNLSQRQEINIINSENNLTL